MDREIRLVQDSFAAVGGRANGLVTLFYMRLFELDPSLRRMFPENLDEQRAKLLKTLAVAVSGLNDLDALVPVLQQLGRNHVPYGVTAPMYRTVGEALLWALESTLCDDFTPAAKDAWAKVYGVMADTMCAAAYGKAGKAA